MIVNKYNKYENSIDERELNSLLLGLEVLNAENKGLKEKVRNLEEELELSIYII